MLKSKGNVDINVNVDHKVKGDIDINIEGKSKEGSHAQIWTW